MYNYISGKVVLNECNYIVVDNSGIGYQIFVANPFSFEINKNYQIYLYNHIREDEFSLYGFKTLEEKELFMRLINVKGLGPKMALPMLATGSVSGIIDAIDRENLLYLTKFPKIGDKLATKSSIQRICVRFFCTNPTQKPILSVLKGKICLTRRMQHTDKYAQKIGGKYAFTIFRTLLFPLD